MDEKLKPTLNKIVQLTKQNPEFEKELRKALEIRPSANSASIDDERINQIYEYCIEKIIRRQATEFYSDFPIESITDQLIDDFVNMEFFRRKDDFGNFCIALYQQIENITNKLCEKRALSDIVEKMWAYPAYVKEGRIDNRPDSEYSIAKLIFPGASNRYFERSKVTLQSQYAGDKIRIIVYYLGYKAALENKDYDSYVKYTSLMNDIYQCRNMNHRGNTLTEWEQNTLNRILPMKSFYYFKFLGALAQYIKYIKEGLLALNELSQYVESLEVKKVKSKGPKVVGKIELSEKDKNRFNRK